MRRSRFFSPVVPNALAVASCCSALLTIIIIAVCVPISADAQSLQIAQQNLETDVCHSTTDWFRTGTLAIRSMPSGREVIYSFPGNAPKIEIDCLSVREFSSSANSFLCDEPTHLYLCKAKPQQTNWECELLEAYLTMARHSMFRGSLRGDAYQWRIEWDGNGKGTYCYPRDVLLTVLARTAFPRSDTIGLIIAVIFIIIVVFALLALFGGYRFKKSLSRLWRKGSLPSSGPQTNVMDAPPPISLQSILQSANYHDDGTTGHPPPTPLREDGTSMMFGPPTPYERQDITIDTFSPSALVDLPRPGTSLMDRQLHQNAGITEYSPPGAGGVAVMSHARGRASAYRHSVARIGSSPHLHHQSYRDQDRQNALSPIRDDGHRVLAVAALNRSIVVPRTVFNNFSPSRSPQFNSARSVDKFGIMSASKDDILVCADCYERVQEMSTPKTCRVSGKQHY